MTDYDPKPTAVHQQERLDDDSGTNWLGWIIGLLVLAAIVWALFYFLDVDQTEEGNLELPSISVEGGDIDLPEFDVETGSLDVDLPSISVEGGDVDMRPAAEGCEADDISAADCVIPDVDVDVDVDADVDVDEPR